MQFFSTCCCEQNKHLQMHGGSIANYEQVSTLVDSQSLGVVVLKSSLAGLSPA